MNLFFFRCPYIALEEAEESDPEDEDVYQAKSERLDKAVESIDIALVSTRRNPYEWDGISQSAVVNGEKISAGDFIFAFEEVASSPMHIARIEFFFKRNFCDKIHCQKLW